MHSIFQVSIEDIQSLDDTQARELVSRLCRAELKSKGFSEAFVTWGGDQRAKDGGVDVRVNITPPVAIDGYIPKSSVVFQVKAETFSSAKIPKEMMPKGELRASIQELASNDGAYVIVSTKDNTSDTSLESRKKAMLDCLTSNGLAGKVQCDFYDSRKIADWVEQHPAVFYWLKHVLNKRLFGWRPYSPWAYREDDIAAEYLLDDKAKVFIPNSDEGIGITAAIEHLRNILSSNVSVRIVGLSGVGKTRLVQALFDSRIGEECTTLDPENVLYTDLSDNPTPQPNAMAEALLSADSDCILIVDNCGPDAHQKLTEIVKRSGSKLRLVTIEYDIRDDLPESTVCYRLEGSSEDVIKRLLKHKYPKLSDPDIDKITEFSDGNARVALALASSSETKGELAQLGDAELFKRLFLQKNGENEGLLKAAEFASLLYSFDFEDTSTSSELAILSKLADTTIPSFSRNIVELKNRGLVQERGRWRAVLPHAISNRLALRAIEAYPKDLLINGLVDNASERVARSFSRRLGYLHESNIARDIIGKWLSPNERLGGLTKLSQIEREIFINIAPVNQQATLDALQRAAEHPEFVSPTNHSRHYFARVARSLAYEPNLFDQAVSILIKFALVEPEDHKDNSVRDILKSLFFCHLSGTEALAGQRAMFVRSLTTSKSICDQKLGLTLLHATLEATHFTSHYDFDFGARKRGYGWFPTKTEDVFNWYRPFINLATDCGMNDSEAGKEARSLLGHKLRGLFSAGLVDELIIACRKLASADGFPEGWHGIRQTIHFDKSRMPEDVLSKLMSLESELAPKDLKKTIQAKIFTRGSYDVELGNDTESISVLMERARNQAQDLGRALAGDEKLLLTMTPEFLQRNISSGQVREFGFGVGSNSKNIWDVINVAREQFQNAENDPLNLIFIRGLISGWNTANPSEVSRFLDIALQDDVWARWFPELQLTIELDDIAHSRLMKSLELGKAPSWQFKHLMYGRVTGTLSVTQISMLIDAIAVKADDGLAVSIDVLQMMIFCSKEKNEVYAAELAKYCIKYLQQLDWSKFDYTNDNLVHDLADIINFALNSKTSEEEVANILSKFINFEREGSPSYHHPGKLLRPFFEHFPKLTLNTIFIASEAPDYESTLHLMSDGFSDRQETAISKIPANALIEWCSASPNDRYLFAAHTCKLYEKVTRDDKSYLVLSDIAKHIFTKASDKQTVIEIFISRFMPSGWSGSLVTILRARLSLLDELSLTDDQVVKDLVITAKNGFIQRIEIVEKREDEEERSRTGSFE